MKQLPDTYNILEIQCMNDSSRLFVDRSDYERLEEALAAKTADFDRLCKDFDAHDAELKRIIAGLRAELALAAAAERERCAKVCEDRGNRNRIAANLPNADRDEFYCADDIRALGGE